MANASIDGISLDQNADSSDDALGLRHFASPVVKGVVEYTAKKASGFVELRMCEVDSHGGSLPGGGRAGKAAV